MRKVIYGLSGVVVLVVAAAFIVPSLIDFNAYKSDIQAEARKATGRDLVIDGNIKLAILPSPQLTAEGVRFANLDGSETKDMAQLKSLRVNVALLPLVSGKVEVTQVTLVGATVVLETLPDGRNNWELGGAKPQGGTAGAATGSPQPTPSAPAAGTGSGSNISIKDLAIEDSTLIWRDLRAGKAVRLDAVNGRLSAETLQGPFAARLAFKAGQVPVDLEARTGALSQPAVPISVTVRTNGGQLQFDGKATDPRGDIKVEGALRGSGDSLAALLQSLMALSGTQPASLPPAFGQRFNLETSVAGSRQQVALSGLKLNLGDDTGSGDVMVRLGQPLRADLKLAFSKLDFDRLLAGAKAATPPPAAPSAPAPNRPPAPAATASTGIPADVEGSLDLSVGTIVYQGKTAQNVALKGDLSKGTLTIANIGGQFPGNTVVAASGSVGARSSAGSGKVDVRSANLREFLTWLDVDTASVPADRLKTFSFTGQIAASAEGDLQIANANLQLDDTNAKGAVTIKTAPKPAVVADLTIDTLNVDAYTGPRSGKPSGEKATGAGSGGSPIDAVVKARINRLIVQGTQVDGVDVDVTVAPDRLTFRPSKVANVAGARASWNGTITGYGGATPNVDLTLDLQTADADRLLQFAGVAPPLKNQRIGAFSASGRIAGRTDDLTFNNFAVAALGASVRLTGKLANTASGPSYNFSRLEVKADDGDRFLALLGVPPPVPGQKLGPVSIVGSAQGNLDQANVDLDIIALSAALDLKGTVNGLRGAPNLAMNVGLNHPSFAQLMRIVSPGFSGGQNVGAVKLQARLDGSPARELRITNLRANLGPTTISGSITANMAGAVPNVVANLETSELDLDKILTGQRAELRRLPFGATVLPARFGEVEIAQNNAPGPSGKGVPPAPGPRSSAKGGGRFSTAPLNIAALHSVDGKIDLKSQAVVMAPWRVDGASTAIDLKGGVLHVTRMTGRAFDGDFSLTGTLNAQRLPATMDVKFNVAKLDMGKLSRAIHHKDRFDGDVNVDFALTSSGSSEADLINNLNGNANVGGEIRFNAKVQEVLLGTVAGIAGKTADKFLGQLTGKKGFDTGGDLNAAIGVALQRFANRNNPINGNVTIRNGVATSNNLRITGRQARADTGFTANLPAWTLDATTNVWLDEHPQEPYLYVRNKGVLDDPSLSIDRNPRYAGQQQQSPQQQTSPQPQQDTPQPAPQPKPKKLSPLDLFKKK